MTFIDENEFGEFKQSIDYSTKTGIMKGLPDGSFQPHQYITRAEACKVLISFAIIDAEHVFPFRTDKFKIPDIRGHWAKGYILFFLSIADQGLLPSDTFQPDEVLTQDVALKWLGIVSKACFGVEYTYPKARKNATRAWLSQQLFLCAQTIIKTLSSRAPRQLMKEWVKLRVYDHLPNPNILLVNENKWQDEYNLLCRIAKERNMTKEEYISAAMTMADILYIVKSFEANLDKYQGVAFQYTSLEALKSMLDNSSIKTSSGLGIKLHMSNVEYLNDPGEGSIFLKELEKREIFDSEFAKDEDDITPRKEYITCLITENKEHLPMWVQYGDNAKGCRIEFKLKKTYFTKVRYYSFQERETANTPETAMLDSIVRILNHYTSRWHGIHDCVIFWVKFLLKRVGYYYKESYYEHENEIRYISEHESTEALVYSEAKDGELFPRLYVECEFPLEVKSVTLGPKCEQQEKIALALQQKGIPRVKRSKISFR